MQATLLTPARKIHQFPTLLRSWLVPTVCLLSISCLTRKQSEGVQLSEPTEPTDSAPKPVKIFDQEFFVEKTLDSRVGSLLTRLEMRRLEVADRRVDFRSDSVTAHAHELIHSICTTLFESLGGRSTAQASVPNEMIVHGITEALALHPALAPSVRTGTKGSYDDLIRSHIRSLIIFLVQTKRRDYAAELGFRNKDTLVQAVLNFRQDPEEFESIWLKFDPSKDQTLKDLRDLVQKMREWAQTLSESDSLLNFEFEIKRIQAPKQRESTTENQSQDLGVPEDLFLQGQQSAVALVSSVSPKLENFLWDPFDLRFNSREFLNLRKTCSTEYGTLIFQRKPLQIQNFVRSLQDAAKPFPRNITLTLESTTESFLKEVGAVYGDEGSEVGLQWRDDLCHRLAVVATGQLGEESESKRLFRLRVSKESTLKIDPKLEEINSLLESLPALYSVSDGFAPD